MRYTPEARTLGIAGQKGNVPYVHARDRRDFTPRVERHQRDWRQMIEQLRRRETMVFCVRAGVHRDEDNEAGQRTRCRGRSVGRSL